MTSVAEWKLPAFLMPVRGWIDALCGRTDDQFLTIVTALTLGILIFHGYSHVYFSVPFQLLAIAFLVLPALQRQGGYWFLVACFSAAAVWLDWTDADNHKYLLCYWTITLFLAFDGDRTHTRVLVRQSARYLLLFTMAWAVVQKTLSPDYLSGDFFEFIFMTDRRFSAFSSLLTGMDPSVFSHNRELYARALDAMQFDQPLGQMQTSAALHTLAVVVSWINYLDQLVIALLLLLPLSGRGEVVKHLLLMAFIVPVYAVAPVIGFGWLIVVWGYCLVPDRYAWLRLGYIGLFLLLSAYEFPWLSLLV